MIYNKIERGMTGMIYCIINHKYIVHCKECYTNLITVLTLSCLVNASKLIAPCGDCSIKPWGNWPTNICPKFCSTGAKVCPCNWFNSACRLTGLRANGAVIEIPVLLSWLLLGAVFGPAVEEEGVEEGVEFVKFIVKGEEAVMFGGRAGVDMELADSSAVGVSKFGVEPSALGEVRIAIRVR